MKKKEKNLDTTDEAREFREFLDNTNWHLLPSDKDSDYKKNTKKHKRKRRLHSIPKKTLDLHGLSVEEARNKIDHQIRSELKRPYSCFLLVVITGKGLHSQVRGGVLCKEIHSYITEKYSHIIEKIDMSPDDVRVGGLPLRGHFKVLMKKTP